MNKEQKDLEKLLKAIPTIGILDQAVANKVGKSVNMIKAVKQGVRWKNEPEKLKELIKLYKSEFNKFNNKLQKL